MARSAKDVRMPAHSGRRDVRVITFALVVANVAGLTFLAVVARWLTPTENARFLALWGLIFGLSAVVGAGEQDAARATTAAGLRGEPVPAEVVQLVAVYAAGMGLVLGVLALVSPSSFGGRAAGTFVALAVLGMSVQVPLRGALLGLGHTLSYAWAIGLEALLRLGLVWLLTMTARPTVATATAGVAIGSMVWATILPLVVPRMRRRSGRRPWRQVVGAVGTLAGGNALQACLLTGFPAVVAALAPQAAAGAAMASLFGAITLSRLPLVALAPIQALTVPHVTRLAVEGRVRQLRTYLVRAAALAAGAAATLAAAAYWLGPMLLRVLMGPGYELDAWILALLMGSSAFLAAALLQVAACIALQRYRWVLLTWALAVAGTLLVLLVGPASLPVRAATALAIGSAIAYVVSAASVGRGARVARVGTHEVASDVGAETTTIANAANAKEIVPTSQTDPGVERPVHHHE